MPPSPLSLDIELTTLQKDNTPCCICFTQKESKSIVEYKCKQCNEGVVCMECAAKLWKTSAKNKCPICKNPSNPPDTWYKSYDIEMGVICPPESPTHDPSQHVQQGFRWRTDKDSLILAISLCLFIIFVGFIVGTLVKVIGGLCAWNCEEEPTSITIITSIGFGIIGIPVIILTLAAASFIFCAGLECLYYGCQKFYSAIARYCDAQQEPFHIACKDYIKNKAKFCSGAIGFLLVSFCAGMLFKVFTKQCYWDCPGQTRFYTIFTSTLSGMPILLLSMLVLMVAFAIFSICFIACIELGTANQE